MRRSRIVITYGTLSFLALLLLSSCAQQVPLMSNENKGCIAIPIKVSDSTQTGGIAFRYELTSSVDTEVTISFTPRTLDTFVFSDEIDPGTYYLNVIIGYHRNNPNTGTKSDTWSFKPTESLTVVVEEGKVTIPQARIEVQQFSDSATTFKTICDIRLIDENERDKYVVAFNDINRDGEWVISGIPAY